MSGCNRGDEMKETVLDVLMYLFETYVSAEEEQEPDRNVLRVELEDAGFENREIEKALEWLDGLSESCADPATDTPTDRAIRLFNADECLRLDPSCRGYLMHLEQTGILSAAQRELIIDRLMALESESIDVEQIKWVALMVLFSQPDQDVAYARMEDLVFEDNMGVLH